jgi:hypothetical protein
VGTFIYFRATVAQSKLLLSFKMMVNTSKCLSSVWQSLFFVLKRLNLQISFIFIFLCSNLSAQYDSIKFANGSKQAAKIIEISDKYVKYKNPLDTLGPTYSVKRKDVAGFVLKSGCVNMDQQGYVNCVKDPTFELVKDKEFTRRIISVDVSQLFVKHFQMNAEYVFKNKSHSIDLFFNIGIPDIKDKNTYTGMETKVFSSGYYKKYYFGFDLKFFPSPHKKVTYFYAFGFDYGTANKMEVTSYYFGPNSLLAHKTTYNEARYFGYRFNNGVLCRFTKNIVCQAILTLGANQYNVENIKTQKQEYFFFPKISGSLLLGYAF